MDATNQNASQSSGYDAAGNVQNDGVNTYAYDAEGRICAVMSEPVQGTYTMTGYLYDADGNRVAKGTITSMNCDPGSNGFQLTGSYVLDLSDEELTMLDGNSNWQRTNVFGADKQLATYDSNGLHFQVTDPLGTRRLQTSDVGQSETEFQGLPFGDGFNGYPAPNAPATADDATPLHFTGKERDIESGNDYFGARYYASTMGRFLSPDPSQLSIQPNNPQTWNRYAYVYNNPLGIKDDNGKWPTAIHNQIIDNAFPNLSPAQRQILKNVSASQDSILGGGQANGLSFEHAMRSPDQTVGQAQAQYNGFVSSSETEAQNAQLQFWMADPDNKLDNLSDASLEAFGEALHAVVDATSPAHEGFPEWDWTNPGLAWRHHNAEKTITPEQLARAVAAARGAYNATYGYLIGPILDNSSVTTVQGSGTPCGGSTGTPCPK